MIEASQQPILLVEDTRDLVPVIARELEAVGNRLELTGEDPRWSATPRTAPSF